MPEPTVLILGCGMGGVVAAREARKRLPSSHRVIVVDREARASYPPSYLWVATGERRPQAISRQRTQLASRGIEFAIAEVRQIDLANRYVRADSREFHYDYLVIALGAETTLDTKPGLAEAAHSFYTLEGAERLAASLRYFAGGRILITVAGPTFKGPSAPYEAAMLLEHHFHDRRMRQKVEIELWTPETEPLAFAGEQARDEIMGLLAHKGIVLRPGQRLLAVDPAKREAAFADETRSFQMLIAVPEHRAPSVVREAGLVDASGWVPVDAATLETKHDNVFAIGDIAHLSLPGGRELPKAGIFAETQAATVAAVIAHRAGTGKAPPPFEATGRFFLEVGAGAAAPIEGNFAGSPRRLVMKQPSIIWHWAKQALEKYWLWKTY